MTYSVGEKKEKEEGEVKKASHSDLWHRIRARLEERIGRVSAFDCSWR